MEYEKQTNQESGLKEFFFRKIAPIGGLLLSANFSNKSKYNAWLSQAYHIVKHSTPLLALCCSRAGQNRDFHNRCIDHLAEEKGHDKLILNDLKNSSLSLLDESYNIKALTASQYYLIEHVSPFAFMGYVLFLELLAVEYGEMVMQQATESGAKTSFLKLHASEDVDHIEKALKAIEALSLTDQELVKDNFLMSLQLYSNMLRELT